LALRLVLQRQQINHCEDNMTEPAPTYTTMMDRIQVARQRNLEQQGQFEAWATASGWERIEDRFGCVIGWERNGYRVLEADLRTHWVITVAST
jgi:hypothetical protein